MAHMGVSMSKDPNSVERALIFTLYSLSILVIVFMFLMVATFFIEKAKAQSITTEECMIEITHRNQIIEEMNAEIRLLKGMK